MYVRAGHNTGDGGQVGRQYGESTLEPHYPHTQNHTQSNTKKHIQQHKSQYASMYDSSALLGTLTGPLVEQPHMHTCIIKVARECLRAIP